MDYAIKKIRVYGYYLNPESPTFLNALGSLTKAGHSYAKSYGSKVFFMGRFIDALWGKTRGSEGDRE